MSAAAAAAGAGAGAGGGAGSAATAAASPASAAAAAAAGGGAAGPLATSTVSSSLAVGLSARDTRDLATALGNPSAAAATGMIVDVVDVRVADLDPDLLEPLNQKAKLTDTLTTLHGSDPKFALFVIEEYEKLQHALKISHDSVIKWLNTLKALTKSIRANSQRLSASIGLHDSELKKREDIKRKIEENKRRKGVFEADISRYRLMIKELKAEIDGLKQAEKDSTDETVRKKYDEIHKLEDEHTKLTKERDAAANQRMALNKANVDAYNRWVELEAKRTAGEEEIKALDSQIKFQRAKSSAEEKNRAEWDAKRKHALDRKTFLERAQQTKLENLNKLKRDLAEATLRQSKFAAEADAEQTRRDELKAERALKQGQCKIAERKNVAKKSEIAAKAAELEKQAAATMREKQNAEKELMKLNLMVQAKTEILARERADKGLKKSIEDELQAVKYGLHMISDTEYETLKSGHADLIIEWKKEKFHGKKGIEDLKDDLKAKEKVVESFVRERDVLNQKIMAKVADIREKDALLKIMKSLLKNVKNEHDAYTVSLRQLAKQNERDELELKKHDANLVKRQLQKARARDEVAERDLKIEQFRAQISSNASALKTHTNLLDAAQSQYNVYRKKSVEQKTEQHEQERVLKSLNKSIERLRKEIADGDKEFASKQIDWVKVRGETEDVRHLNSEASDRVGRATDTLNSQAVKVRTLSQFIADADEEIRLQRKQYHTVVDEQRTLNQQLIQRNEQLAKLYEQLKLQYSFKEKNKTFYGDHLALLSGLRASKEQLSAQFDELNQRCHIYDELKLTIDGVTRELTGEQLRVRALQDELHKLINVHRWRKLADTNTDAYDMVQRVHALTKQIIDKTSAVQARDAAIAEREKMYVNLRKVVSRQPGAEAMEQLRMYATTLREKKAKLKSIRAELGVFQRRVLEYKDDLSKIDADLKLVKVAYFQLRQEQARSGGALSARSALNSGRPDSQGGTGGPLPPLGATGGGVGGAGGYDNAIEELKRQQSEQAAAHEQLLAGLHTSSSGAATSAAAGAAALASLASLVHAPTASAATAADDLAKPGAASGTAGTAAADPAFTPSKADAAARKGLGTPRTAVAAAASGARPPAADADPGFAI